MVRSAYYVQCACGARTSGFVSSLLNFSNSCVGSFDCAHIKAANVHADVTWGFFFGLNAKIAYRFEITCKCNKKREFLATFAMWGRGTSYDSMNQCSDCGAKYVILARENDFLMTIPTNAIDELRNSAGNMMQAITNLQ